MIYLENDQLEIRFPELHENAGVSVSFVRTLRLPDDGEVHFLPPGFSSFPLRHIEDFDLGRNKALKKRGGVIMPMFQADALWISFNSMQANEDDIKYPIALKIGTGKVCAISGDRWSNSLNLNPQDYLVVPEQPWLDGYNVGKSTVKQFVAAPLGQGYTAEEQITGEAIFGGIQIQAFPMKKEYYNRLNQPIVDHFERAAYSMSACPDPSFEMGLAPGGEMFQEIFDDPHDFEAWDLRKTERCFLTLANASQWMSITGEEPPLSPQTADDYTDAGLPWFEYFGGDKIAIEGAKRLGKLKSMKHVQPKTGENIWPTDQPIQNPKVVPVNKKEIKVGVW